MLSLRSKAATKIVSQIWVLDILFRTGLIIFNYRVWSTIISLQEQRSVCEGGFGQWTILSSPVNLSVRHPAATFAFAYCILDIMWEVFRFVAHITKTWAMETMRTIRSDDAALDPRFWCLQKAVFYGLRKCGFIYTQEAIVLTRLSKLMLVISFLQKWIVFIFISVAIENTIVVNGLATAESHWTFGQIFAMVNMFSLASILFSHAKPTVRSTINWISNAPFYNGIVTLMFLVTCSLIFFSVGRNFKEPAETLVLPIWVGYPLVLVLYLMWAVFMAAALTGFITYLMDLFLFILRGLPLILEKCKSTTSPTFGAIIKVCSYVVRPFGYALGIIEEETHEEETGSTLNQLNV